VKHQTPFAFESKEIKGEVVIGFVGQPTSNLSKVWVLR
jgi:hypothetical protein